MKEEYTLIISLVIASAALITALLALIKYHSKSANINLLKTQIEGSELLISQLRLSLSDVQKQLILLNETLTNQQVENEQVSKQLEHRIKILNQDIKKQSETIEQVKLQQPEDKLYSRAQKLVLLGADVAELMTECDLPQAEAEMLVTLHKRKL
ncbi:DUF2802 domain-containing protein [Thalassotalea profundi]|nr:DUF2802 domain-containing protein [Thalassotalea profundi]